MKVFLMALALIFSASSFAANQIEDLFQSEMAAVRTYNKVIEVTKDSEEINKLKEIRDEHEGTAEKLKAMTKEDLKEDKDSAGVWSMVTKAYSSGAKLVGTKAALKALKHSEQLSLKNYKDVLKSDSIKPALKDLIKDQLLPKKQGYLETLSSLI